MSRTTTQKHHELLSALTHDFGAPLRQVEAFMDALYRRGNIDLLDDRSKKYLQNIKNATYHASLLLNGVVSYSQACRKDFVPEEICCNHIIDNIIQNDLSTLIEERKASINIGALPTITGDRLLLHNMFLNLLKNGLLYQKPNNVVIIDCRAIYKDNHWIFCIKDNGIGIANGRKDLIFKMLKRDTRMDEFEGVGAGLAVVSEIAERHGGYVWIEDTSDIGSQFNVSLPC